MQRVDKWWWTWQVVKVFSRNKWRAEFETDFEEATERGWWRVE